MAQACSLSDERSQGRIRCPGVTRSPGDTEVIPANAGPGRNVVKVSRQQPGHLHFVAVGRGARTAVETRARPLHRIEGPTAVTHVTADEAVPGRHATVMRTPRDRYAPAMQPPRGHGKPPHHDTLGPARM